MAQRKTRLGLTATPAGTLYIGMPGAGIISVFYGLIRKVKAYIKPEIDIREK